MDKLMSVLLIVSGAIIIGVLSAVYFGDDNPIEEIAEEIIKAQSGIEIDLTPASPEKEEAEAFMKLQP